MAENRQESAWRPCTPAITGLDIEEAESHQGDYAVHFWADWNRYDKDLDQVLKKVEPQLVGKITFYSCDIDSSENWQHLRAINLLQVPMIGIYRSGKLIHKIVGLRKEKQLVQEILTGLDKGARTRPWWKFWRSSK